MFSAKWDRAVLLEQAGTQDYRTVVSTAKGIKAIARQIIGNRILES
jgi:hypothetical protein